MKQGTETLMGRIETSRALYRGALVKVMTKLKPKRRLRRKEEVGLAVYRQALVKVWKHGSPRRFTYSIQIEGEYVGSDPYVGVDTGSQVCHHGDCAGVQIAFAEARKHIDSILGVED